MSSCACDGEHPYRVTWFLFEFHLSISPHISLSSTLRPDCSFLKWSSRSSEYIQGANRRPKHVIPELETASRTWGLHRQHSIFTFTSNACLQIGIFSLWNWKWKINWWTLESSLSNLLWNNVNLYESVTWNEPSFKSFVTISLLLCEWVAFHSHIYSIK